MAYNDIAFYHLVRLCFLLVFHDCPNNVCYVMKPSVTNTSIKDCKVTYFFTLCRKVVALCLGPSFEDGWLPVGAYLHRQTNKHSNARIIVVI